MWRHEKSHHRAVSVTVLDEMVDVPAASNTPSGSDRTAGDTERNELQSRLLQKEQLAAWKQQKIEEERRKQVM